MSRIVSAEAQEFPYGVPAVSTSMHPFVPFAQQVANADDAYTVSLAFDALYWEYSAHDWYQMAVQGHQRGDGNQAVESLLHAVGCWDHAGRLWQSLAAPTASHLLCGMDSSALAPVLAQAVAQAQQMSASIRAQVARYGAQYGLPLPAELQEGA